MDINKILSADILDIIFEGKNKQYGAYDLRKTYNKRLAKALIITAALGLLIFLGSVTLSAISKKASNAPDALETQLAELKKMLRHHHHHHHHRHQRHHHHRKLTRLNLLLPKW